jgi:hypothetical protein
MLQVQFLCVYGQSEVEIYIIGSTLKYIPSTRAIHSLWVELDAGEFPKMRNGWQLKIVKHKCVLQGQFWSVSSQSEVEIYIIGTPLKYISSTATIHWL